MKAHQVKFPILLFSFTISVIASDNNCIPRSYGLDSVVCVCNATYCDTISPIKPLPPTQYVVITSNEAGLRFNKIMGSFTKSSGSPRNTITINPDEQRQSIIGWGGALTDSTGINIDSLSDGAKQHLLRSYFSEEGIEYSLVRVPMGCTDFSTHAYSYDDGRPDKRLRHFKLAPEDYKYKIPLLKEARTLSKDNIRLFTSTWAAPKWMKTNDRYSGVGFIKRKFYQTWADYFLKFLQWYKKEGLMFWGITTGNEPKSILIPTPLPVVGWQPNNMGQWIANNLGPTLRNSEFSSIKILALDDQRLYLSGYLDKVFSSNTSRNYVDGIAVHWYSDSFVPPSALSKTHEQFPNKFILYTEASIAAPVALGSWTRAESYAVDIFQNLHHWVTGWTDWNMALDMTGGPTYIHNNLDSSIIVNAAKGEFYKQPMFYVLGHFSKFIPRESVKIGIFGYEGDLDIVGFQRPDNATALTILNRKSTDETVILRDNTRGDIQLVVGAKSINTVLFW